MNGKCRYGHFSSIPIITSSDVPSDYDLAFPSAFPFHPTLPFHPGGPFRSINGKCRYGHFSSIPCLPKKVARITHNHSTTTLLFYKNGMDRYPVYSMMLWRLGGREFGASVILFGKCRYEHILINILSSNGVFILNLL